jgi:imidazolonepropionase-like amidohydrolase
MRRLALIPLLLAVPLPTIAADGWLIQADKIYTAPDAPPLSNGVVLIADGRIVSVADERARIRIPAGTQTSDCRGVVTAGFQNSHVHFTEDVWTDAAHAPPEKLARGLEAMLTRYGFTTVFDTASDQVNTLALRQRIEKGELSGPRILTVGQALYPPEGIPSYIRDLPPAQLAKSHQPRNAQEARADVRQNLAQGADGTKLFLHTSPARGVVKFMSLEVARTAAEETHAKGKLVFAHPTSLDGVRGAIAAGVDILVHTTLGEKQPWDKDLLAQMTAKHMSVIPTFKLWKYELRKEDAPPAIIEKLIASTQEELRAFSAAGGQVLFGTDVGYMHEYDPTEEYSYMSGAGLTPMQILASLTTAPAARFNETQRRGRVAPKLDADLVVLAADPADDVKNFANVRCVFRGGRLIYSAPAPGAGS